MKINTELFKHIQVKNYSFFEKYIEKKVIKQLLFRFITYIPKLRAECKYVLSKEIYKKFSEF